MQLNMLEAMNIYVNVVEQGSFIRAAEVLELHRPALPAHHRTSRCAYQQSRNDCLSNFTTIATKTDFRYQTVYTV